MPTVAEKLCHDLVEPVLKPSSNNNNVKFKQTKKPIKSTSNFNAKPTRSIYLEKRRVINNIIPSENKKIARTLKSKETILKKRYVDIAVNTLVTGPLRCDNYCVTMVQKRDQKLCKCGKVRPRASSKIIQTLYKNSYMQRDKACAQCVEKVNCGTQFLEKKNSILKPESTKKVPKSKTNINFIIPHTESFQSDHHLRKSSRIYIYDKKHSEGSYHNLTTHCLGGKRWALSNYPKRGPDF